MMKNVKLFVIILAVMVISLTIASCGEQPASTPEESNGYQVTNLTDEARDCVECHATETHGIVEDWDGSRHADEAVSCIDCHEVEAGSPLAGYRQRFDANFDPRS
jgi:cytochrome c553